MHSARLNLIITVVIIYFFECGGQQVHYEPIRNIWPGQTRYSSANVDLKKHDLIKKKYAVEKADGSWRLRYDNGKSALPPSEALPVVIAPFGYVLIDGHHHVIASLNLGGTTVPIKVVSDMSQLSEDEFWVMADSNGLVYPYAKCGIWKIPPRFFTQLEDDPNRYFAKITARTCKRKHGESSGAKYPVWVKTGEVYFPEFKIADILWRNDMIYEYRFGQNPPDGFVERVRGLLARQPPYQIEIIPTRQKYSDIEGLCERVQN